MHRLLIVEDEKWEREGLVDFLDWTEQNINIVGAVANGVQGLKLAKEYQPDIVITDIKMPIMDGMEFTRKVKQILPDCRVIIITGYDDFEYAREAIQLGVFDYLLKPIQKDQLLGVLDKTVKSISEETSQAESLRVLKHQINESMYEDRERFLLSIIDGHFSRQKSAEYFDRTLCEAGCVAVVIRFNVFSFFRGKKASERQTYLRELYRAIRNSVGEEGITAQNHTRNNEMIICLPAGIDVGQYINGLFQRARQENEGIELLKAFTGVGSISGALQEFDGSFAQAEAALDHLFFEDEAENLFYDDIPLGEEVSETEIYDFFSAVAGYPEKLLNGIVSLDICDANALLDELFKFIRNQSADKGLVCDFIAGLVSELSTLLLSYDGSLEYFGLIKEDIAQTLDGFIRLEDIKEWLVELVYYTNSFIAEKKVNKEKNIVEKVNDIIRNEYADSIGIATIAHRMELSPNYLGCLFKQYMGDHFTDVLTDFRMKRAEELLLSGTKNVMDTAKAVGFINVAYFCTVFKKNHGISPSDYQKKFMNKNGFYE